MVSKKFREASISFGNMVIMDRNGKSQIRVDEEVVSEKDSDPVSTNQFSRFSVKEEREMMVEEIEFGS